MDSFLDDYVDDVSSRVVVLGMYGSEPKFKFPHYRHRFPRSRLHEALKLYNAVCLISNDLYPYIRNARERKYITLKKN